jgi:hypothetical protein
MIVPRSTAEMTSAEPATASSASAAGSQRTKPKQVVLCWASTHGFDPDFHGDAAPAGARLIRAAQQPFRRAAGIPADPPG